MSKIDQCLYSLKQQLKLVGLGLDCYYERRLRKLQASMSEILGVNLIKLGTTRFGRQFFV